MSSCNNAYFNGWGECSSMLSMMNGASLNKKGTEFTDATALSLSTWRTGIADADEANRNILMLPIMSFENTTDDVEISTTTLGKKYVSSKPIPSGLIYLDASLCDYKQLHDLEGTWFEFVPFYQDGTYWMTRKSDGALKGFRCKIATKAGFAPDDKTQSFPVYLMFDSYNEFEDVVVVNPDFDFGDLQQYSATGLDIRITTAYTAGDVVVKVTKRGSGDGLTGLAAADFEVLESNAEPTVAVTAASDDGLGQYTLTIKADNDGTPANLTSGQYALVQASEDDGTYVTYLSHSVKVTVL